VPRGGKRPGAGAPRGNFNGLRTGEHSTRMRMVFAAMINHADYRALARELHHAGFYPAPHYRFNNDLRGLVAYLYTRWFDCAPGVQSIAINCTQVHGRLRPDGAPPADTNAPEDAPERP
jgi:hypothetical protein